MRSIRVCRLILAALALTLAPALAGGALAQDGRLDPVAAARDAVLHLQFEVTGPPAADAGSRCAMPAVARRVFRADGETADLPPRPINPVSAGTALTLVMPCLNTDMPFEPVHTSGPLAERARVLDPPWDGSRRLRVPVPRERRVPRPGEVLEAFLTPSLAPDGPCGEPFSVEQGRWVVPRALIATPVTRPGDAPQLRDPPGMRLPRWALPSPPVARENRPFLFPTRDVAVTFRHSARPGETFRAAFSACEAAIRTSLLDAQGQPRDGALLEQRTGGLLQLRDAERRMEFLARRPGQPSNRIAVAPDHATFRREGEASVAGLACTLWRVTEYDWVTGNARRAGVEMIPAQLCVTADGVVLRRVDQDGRMEAVSVDYAPQDRAAFRSEGYAQSVRRLERTVGVGSLPEPLR
ncbi:hypothetical protein [Roseomonas sp. BN140053]|uniref:hypothetical protein n=1 Tax=Roseomonas sp. BN140053 TaxID=3391898 RepID=UPI0039EB57E7